jgi:hypothetical protein
MVAAILDGASILSSAGTSGGSLADKHVRAAKELDCAQSGRTGISRLDTGLMRKVRSRHACGRFIPSSIVINGENRLSPVI